MIVTFNDKDYEVEDERVTEIFEDVKKKYLEIIDKYNKDNRDTILAQLSVYAFGSGGMETVQKKYGIDEIVKILGAKPV